ncbi:hypothetical protein INS49_000704 [Diaporthe citri]|uniref:uncharacterized protein n=1 Tax=Diaporthe citri TaxID=83186 RepID=UPI001C7ED38E|nr:uncharacterized protein INS49_000704 [Diaporthe citri]KAG6366527.1 hypothetical protein INS49_000704 [Diaporthe citri]
MALKDAASTISSSHKSYALPDWFLEQNVKTSRDLATIPDQVVFCNCKDCEGTKLADDEFEGAEQPGDKTNGANKKSEPGQPMDEMHYKTCSELRDVICASFMPFCNTRLKQDSTIVFCMQEESTGLLEPAWMSRVVENAVKATRGISMIFFDLETLEELGCWEPNRESFTTFLEHFFAIRSKAKAGEKAWQRNQEVLSAHLDPVKVKQTAECPKMKEGDDSGALIIHIMDCNLVNQTLASKVKQAVLMRISEMVRARREQGEAVAILLSTNYPWYRHSEEEFKKIGATRDSTVAASRDKILDWEQRNEVRTGIVNTQRLRRVMRHHLPSNLFCSELLKFCSDWTSTNRAQTYKSFGKKLWSSGDVEKSITILMGRGWRISKARSQMSFTDPCHVLERLNLFHQAESDCKSQATEEMKETGDIIDTARRQDANLAQEIFSAVFTGSSGSGKSTVARLYAQFLSVLGVVPNLRFEQTTGARLADGGVSERKAIIRRLKKMSTGDSDTDSRCEKMLGVIFIDGAHKMVPDGANKPFNYLMDEVQRLQGQVVFLFAGSLQQMQSFMGLSPSLRSHVPFTFKLDDFTDGELHQILVQQLQPKFQGKMRVEGGVNGIFMRILTRRIGRGRGGGCFANARDVQNALLRVLLRQANRLSHSRRLQEDADDLLLTHIDLLGPPPISTLENKTSLNKVFLGNPGTGKTTVAKHYARILTELGLLSNGEVIVKSFHDFIGMWRGHSENLTKEILDSAQGKVLIIDEAYGLGRPNRHNNFSRAVIDTMVSEVQATSTEDRAVLLLGYKDEMEECFGGSILVSEEDSRSQFKEMDFDPDYDRQDRAQSNIQEDFTDFVGADALVAKFQAYQRIAQKSKDIGLDPRDQIPFNFVFRGPPGKTTTARKLGQIFFDMGFLATREVELIAEYVGQTDPKTQEMFQKALGRVLFIDEAYRLAEKRFGKEAVDEIINLVTLPKYKNRMVVVLAGYDQDINHLLATNPGFGSRFSEVVEFSNLSPSRCQELLVRLLEDRKLGVSSLRFPSVAARTKASFQTLSHVPGWGNARDVENLATSLFGKVVSVPVSPPCLHVASEWVYEKMKEMIAERRKRAEDASGFNRATNRHRHRDSPNSES